MKSANALAIEESRKRMAEKGLKRAEFIYANEADRNEIKAFAERRLKRALRLAEKEKQ